MGEGNSEIMYFSANAICARCVTGVVRSEPAVVEESVSITSTMQQVVRSMQKATQLVIQCKDDCELVDVRGSKSYASMCTCSTTHSR